MPSHACSATSESEVGGYYGAASEEAMKQAMCRHGIPALSLRIAIPYTCPDAAKSTTRNRDLRAATSESQPARKQNEPRRSSLNGGLWWCPLSLRVTASR